MLTLEDLKGKVLEQVRHTDCYGTEFIFTDGTSVNVSYGFVELTVTINGHRQSVNT